MIETNDYLKEKIELIEVVCNENSFSASEKAILHIVAIMEEHNVSLIDVIETFKKNKIDGG